MRPLDEQFFSALGTEMAEYAEVAEAYDGAAEAIISDLFEQQQNFILDPYRRKSLLTPRRAGKTHTAISYALWTALKRPYSDVPIISLTLKSAKSLYWDPLKMFSDKYGLRIRFNYSENRAYLANGSKIFLAGAETKADIEKLRGGKYTLAVIDECKSFNTALFGELLREVLEPATNDVSGTIAIIGTPGAILDGPFYEATCPGIRDTDNDLVTRDYYRPEPFWEDPGRAPLWNRHYWTVAENIFCPQIWENALLDKKRNKYRDDNPVWQREYLGQWVSTSDTYVYAMNEVVRADGSTATCRATWKRGDGPGYNKHGLSNKESWEYIMGIDFGFEDAFAVVVVAYSPHSDTMYHVYDARTTRATVPHMANIIRTTLQRFDNEIQLMVADSGGLGKTLIESMNEMYDFFMEPAEKNEKFDHIELLNSDLRTGRLKILPQSDLFEEMSTLQWDLRGLSKKQAIRHNKIREDRNFDNHLCDALLYTWRFCQHHFSSTAPVVIEPQSPEWFEEWDRAEAEKAAAMRDDKKSADPQTVWVSETWDTDTDLVEFFSDRTYKDYESY